MVHVSRVHRGGDSCWSSGSTVINSVLCVRIKLCGSRTPLHCTFRSARDHDDGLPAANMCVCVSIINGADLLTSSGLFVVLQ